MDALQILGYTLAAGIGVSLGLIGGGGSILTLPVLVYTLGAEAHRAVPMSLAVVGATSLVGALLHARRGTVRLRAGLPFAASGAFTAMLGARFTHLLPGPWLLLGFALLMLVVGPLMLTRRRLAAPACRPAQSWRAVGAGAAVGALTGFLGVGGGFLIVPALVLFAGLAMREAVSTSLLVAGLASAGAFAGSALALRVSPATLQRVFALLVIAVGLFLAAANVAALGRG